MKKILLLSVFFAFFACVPHTLAQTQQGFVPLAPIPGLTQNVQATQGGIASFLNNLYKFLIGAAAVLAIIMIIWGGLEISTQDSVSKKSDGKARITQAIFGLVLVLSPVLVFSIINPSILNLSIGMSPIDLSTPPGSSGIQTSTTDANGCVTHGGQYLETAVCPSKAALQKYKCANGAQPRVPLSGGTCTKDSSGNCISAVSIPVYCEQSTTVLYQKATYGWFGILPGWSSTVVPRDAQIQSTFSAGCAGDGGTMDVSDNKASFLAAYSGNCPLSSNVTYQSNAQHGVECFKVILTCLP